MKSKRVGMESKNGHKDEKGADRVMVSSKSTKQTKIASLAAVKNCETPKRVNE